MFQFTSAVRYAVYYYLGAYLYEKIQSVKVSHALLAIFISVGSFAFVENYQIIENQFIILKLCTSVAYCICSIAGVIAAYFVVFLFYDRCGGVRQNMIWKFLKKNSFGIYLFHQQIVYLTIIPLNGKVFPIVQVGISFLTAIIGASVLAYGVRRRMTTRYEKR